MQLEVGEPGNLDVFLNVHRSRSRSANPGRLLPDIDIAIQMDRMVEIGRPHPAGHGAKSLREGFDRVRGHPSKPSSGMLVYDRCIESRLLCKSAPEGDWQFLPMAPFLVNGCLFHPTNSANRKDPPLLAQGRVFSARATAISNIRMLEPQAQKQTTHRAAYRKRGDQKSIGRPPGNRPPDASLAPSCEDYVNVIPVLRAE
jgi:hypothetical protein